MPAALWQLEHVPRHLHDQNVHRMGVVWFRQAAQHASGLGSIILSVSGRMSASMYSGGGV